ncbi:MAG: beta-glucosidase [Armatimonadetes bacterium]|nr:beta-glucosidase [Armatimonadota bacterium]
MKKFPEGFLWGAATSSYQIEGGHDADGKGVGIWDEFCQKPGAIYGGHIGDVGCDHYHRASEDIELMAELNLQAYRFSISWPRVMPHGTGEINEKGLEFYDRLIDSLLAANIRPLVTLYHWDLPQAVQDRGGWLNPEIPVWFEEYAKVVVGRLGDRVKDWITLNEPGIYVNLGHFEGTHAPALKLSPAEILTCYKHTFLAHGRACQVIRELAPNATLSYAPHCVTGEPVDDEAQTVEAAREYTFGESHPDRNFWQQRLYIDPICKGVWPEKLCHDLAPEWELPTSDEMAVIHQPLDHLCLNFYSAPLVDPAGAVIPDAPGIARTLFDWPVRERGLHYAVKFHHERTGLPILISENGLSNMDWVAQDGKVHDPQRLDFLERYLGQLHRSISEGIPVLGYMHWSLMDNFEWADGFKQRFGLIHVDFQTGKRTIKESARHYSEWIRANAIP